MLDANRRRRRRRLVPLMATGAVVAAALLAPSSASAYQQHFCQYVVLPPGADCLASDRHSLLAVYGFSYMSNDRVCVATFTSSTGTRNSDWRCDYSSVTKTFSTRLDGVGAIHNGDPQSFVSYAIQEY